MKKRVTGGVIVAAVALGLYLANLWKGPGAGGPDRSLAVPRDAEVNAVVKPVSTTRITPVESEEPIESVTVIIHAEKYRLTEDDELLSGEDVSLDALLRKVVKTTGNRHGIRIRILLERDAQEGARSDLYAALGANGVKQEEIQEVSGFLD